MGEKRYRPWTPRQAYLLPAEYLAYFVLDVVEQLNLGEIEDEAHRRDHHGERPCAVGMVTGLLLYGYSVGVFSPRRIARATYEGKRSYPAFVDSSGLLSWVTPG